MITGLVRRQEDNWREKRFFGMSEGLLTFASLPEAPLKDLRLSSSLTRSPHEVSLPDNLSGATAVWTAETLHGWWTLCTPEPMGVKLSLKLYHAGQLQLDHQQLMTEAPVLDGNECLV